MDGERFRVARTRHGHTLKDVGAACGVSAQAALKWEQGKAMPSSKALMAFCALTDCSPEWLLSGDPLDFHSTESAPQGRHAKYWVQEALAEIMGNPRLIASLAARAGKETT